MITTVTGKNQITLPAKLVKELDLKPGDRLEWATTEDGALIARRKLTRAELARQLQGRWRHLLKPGEDPIRDLIEERVREDEEERAQGFA